MCLTVKDDAPALVAKEDIVCYKYLYNAAMYYDLFGDYSTKRHIDAGFQYVSPYQGSPYIIGQRYDSRLGDPEHCTFTDDWSIDQGLHSFERAEDAWGDAGLSEMTLVVKCRIPKGAQYYKGGFAGMVSYASTELILDELVDKPE